MRTLVTGGIRSGKSAHAERLLAPFAEVTYVATGPQRDDGDWAARVTAHQERRPATWRTVETRDAADAIATLSGPALLDCLGTWLTGQLDEVGAWDEAPGWRDRLGARTDALLAAWAACPHPLVAVTNEVGWGLVSEHRSGRVFADELGRLNQQVAAASEAVHLVVAGQVLVAKAPA